MQPICSNRQIADPENAARSRSEILERFLADLNEGTATRFDIENRARQRIAFVRAFTENNPTTSSRSIFNRDRLSVLVVLIGYGILIHNILATLIDVNLDGIECACRQIFERL